jgi:hypothetical protein
VGLFAGTGKSKQVLGGDVSIVGIVAGGGNEIQIGWGIGADVVKGTIGAGDQAVMFAIGDEAVDMCSLVDGHLVTVGRSAEEGAEQWGGMFRAVEEGWVRGQIEDTAFRYNRELEEGDRLVVGVNCCQVDEDEVPLEIFSVDPAHEEHQKRSLAEVRERRDAGKVEEALGKISREVRGDRNLMPFLIEAAEAYASIGEMREACSE